MNSLIEHRPGLWTQNLPALRQLSDYKLIAFDMDSTLISIECIDEMAGMVGRQQEVSAITESAMRGEITDYKESLRRRVALLQGAPAIVMQQVFEQKLQLNPGVKPLIAACQQAGLSSLIVSGGFDYFTDKLQALLGIDDTRSNKLEIVDGVLTGHLLDQEWGDICDGEEKKRMLQSTSAKLGINASQCIAVGDGSNDLPMMQWCGLSVAYKAKAKVRQQANIAIDSGGLDRLLELIHP
jgi:phosphoserine phosphatase